MVWRMEVVVWQNAHWVSQVGCSKSRETFEAAKRERERF